MKAAAALSRHPLAAHAVGELAGEILDQLGEQPSLVMLFAEVSHTGAMEDIISATRSLLSPEVLIGSTASGVIAQAEEAEDGGALSIWAATGVDAIPFRIEPGATGPTGGWETVEQSHAVVITDPFSVNPVDVLGEAASHNPELAIHGGMASAAQAPDGNRLFLDAEIYTNGGVGVALDGVEMESIVSQGCRPIGDPYSVTQVREHIVVELGSQPPMQRLRTIAAEASDEDRARMQQGLHVGVVVNETLEDFESGDFLIRGVLGADADSGAIAIGAEVPLGTTLQFHVRDAQSADEDLAACMSDKEIDAALVFTCNGRGRRLFGYANHDAELIHDFSGSTGTAGMFCAGEFGPVSGVNHVHGFTVSSLLFRSLDDGE